MQGIKMLWDTFNDLVKLNHGEFIKYDLCSIFQRYIV